ncbi:MAG: MBL fold metallo-hydrolase [Gammaproteobacteria bacterium]|nr:MBL fold metallo-hydrolase [Gammaproteobacteria bacterium]MDH5654216.1 MBL fold metallo-hydrolase [Gammaproteobacteria bacterium]
MHRCKLMLAGMLLAISSHAPADDKNDLPVNKVKGPLSVMVLGSGGPVATPSGRAGAGYLIFTDGKPRVLMDLGGGTYKSLAESGASIHDMEYILLTHLHADHTGDLTPVVKTIYFHNNRAGTSRNNPINIYGPKANGVTFPGTTITQYPATSEYANDHYAMPMGTERYLNLFARAITENKSSFAYKAYDLNSRVPGAVMETVFSTDDGLVVKAIAVDHGPVPAVAFRIEYKGYSVVYSGDTGSRGPNMVTISQDADLLIYDTAIMADEPANPVFHVLHTEPARIGEVALAANAKAVVLSHITPVTEPRLKEVQNIIRSTGYTGKIKTAKDLKVYNLGGDD